VINPDNLDYAEQLFEQFLQQPNSVPQVWRELFEEFDGSPPAPSFARRSMFDPAGGASGPSWQGGAPTLNDPEAVARRLPFIRRLALFSELPQEAHQLIADISHDVTLGAGEVLFEAGSPGDMIYIVESGKVAVHKGGLKVAEIGESEVIGELSVMDRKPRSADIVTLEDARFLAIGADDLHRLLDRHGEIARALFQTVTQRLRATNARQERVDILIRAYRVRGHTNAHLDPLGRFQQPHPELELPFHGLSDDDLDRVFSTRTLHDNRAMKLRHILERLKNTYCGSIGAQFMHIDSLRVKSWLQTRMERSENRRVLSRDEQRHILTKLTDAETFEDFIHKKYLGAKRFSLEGGETLIPLLDQAIEGAAQNGVEHVIIGMAHRGRLNVMANTMGKSPLQIFAEFEDADPSLSLGRGDVKYHLGFSSLRETRAGSVHLSLCFNPSHLAFVAPVVCGRVRARQDRVGDDERRRVMGLVIHGDAAFAGQGVIQETLNMGGLEGYATGGTIHVIVNNQVGFTTPPERSRTSRYATDVAKMLDIPIFHVNGEDPEAVAQVIQLATDFRSEFQRDVVIDMYCYRKYGHNEGDDPTFTQPLMYAEIARRETVRERYTENLEKLGEISKDEARQIQSASRARLDGFLAEARARSAEVANAIKGGSMAPEIDHQEDGCLVSDLGYEINDTASGVPRPIYVGGADRATPEVETAVELSALKANLAAQLTRPDDFTMNKKLKRFFGAREAMMKGERALDWGCAEALAYGTLLAQGVRVRLSGQDSGRGTFTHRHAILHDSSDGHLYLPLRHVAENQADLQIWDSPLSENSVLGFEYGYSVEQPESLVLWEAQFGDFANGAQVIIDQFISSSEDKWGRLTGMVLLLPHGFEGQGPEHSSARLERFLNLAAEDNMVVVNLTTPAQIFHGLRRHVLRSIRKPLIVMTPKSLLRHPQATSSLEALSRGGFQKVIADPDGPAPAKTRRILLCSGKVYYDLLAGRSSQGTDDVAILRVEQLYPVPDVELRAALADYPDFTELLWVQEEPMNMGAWPAMALRLGNKPFDRFYLKGVHRPESASPATGSKASHTFEQDRLVRQALGQTTKEE
jgi:2-oxoglutarate dehydrogenase E1 component